MPKDVMIVALDTAMIEVAAFEIAQFGGYGICHKRIDESGWYISCRCSTRRCTLENGAAPVFDAVPCPLRG